MDIQIQADTFRSLARKAESETNGMTDVEILESFVGGDAPKQHGRELRATLFTTIKNSIVSDKGIYQVDLRKIERCLYLEFLWHSLDDTHHLIIEHIFHGVNEQYFLPFTHEREWINAITIARLSRRYRDDDMWSGRYLTQDVISKAALRLKDKGYCVNLVAGRFTFEDEEFARLTQEINWLAEQFGGKNLISVLLSERQRNNKFVGTRYRFGRVVQQLDWGLEALPAHPFGYLINIAGKFLKHNPATPRIKQGIQLLETARDLVALLELEDYTAYAYQVVNHKYYPEYVRRTLLGDFCLSYRQLDPSHCLFMIRELFSWVDNDKMRSKLGFGINDILALATGVLERVPASQINTVLKVEDLRNSISIPADSFAKLLPHFIHKQEEINRLFDEPTDSKSVNLDTLPLVWQNGGKILVTSTPFISMSFLETTLRLTKKIYGGADKSVGDAIEPMLEKMFLNRGIEVFACSKKYKTSEVDLVLESPEKIVLFECKKKGLTRPTLGGDMVDGLIDICLTFIQAQCQLVGHELTLLKEGHIKFDDGTVLHHNGRRIEKVAVTLHDLGSLQDRMVTSNTINVLISSVISADTMTPYQTERFLECNELLTRLNTLYKERTSITGESDVPLHDCMFLGTPQIAFLLDHSSDAESFFKNLGMIKTVINGSLDMYATFSSMHSIQTQHNPSPTGDSSTGILQ